MAQFIRMNDIMINQQRALRKRQLIQNYITPGNYNGAYWGIDTNIETYPNIDSIVKFDNKYQSMADLPTQLGPFSDENRDTLINWSYALTDAALRSRYDSLIQPATDLPR